MDEGYPTEEDAFFAHRIMDETGVRSHSLADHLRGVAERAGAFAEAFGSRDWAEWVGLLHDLGKFQPAFQSYLLDSGDADGHIETRHGRVDHSSVGALYSVDRLGERGHIPAYLIAGHHGGLPDFEPGAAQGAGALASRLHRPTTVTASKRPSASRSRPEFSNPRARRHRPLVAEQAFISGCGCSSPV